MTKAWGGNSQWQEYSYNPDGQRTRRKVNGVQTWQIYGFDGELLVEYAANGAVSNPQKEYGYRNGQLLITADGAPTQIKKGLQIETDRYMLRSAQTHMDTSLLSIKFGDFFSHLEANYHDPTKRKV